MKELIGRIAACTSLSLLLASTVMAAATPYFEGFDGYATGDTAVTNFTEVSTSAWQIASPSISGKGYDDGMSVFSAGVGVAVLTNSSATVNFPALASSSFSMSTLFRIDTLTLAGSHVQDTATIGLVARSADAVPASSGADRYQVSYLLDDDGLGHVTGRLWLREVNLFFGDSLDELSASALPVTPGDLYQLTLSGIDSGSSVALTSTLTNLTTASSISVSETDAVNLVSGANFGYFNHVRVVAGGTVALNADFDNFSVNVPEPATSALLSLALIGVVAGCRQTLCRRKSHRT
jgi:hypothetical protein